MLSLGVGIAIALIGGVYALSYLLQILGSAVGKADEVAESDGRAVVVCRGERTNGDLDAGNPYDPSPRRDCLTWDEYFMSLAFLTSQRSKDPRRQVGSCIVDQRNVILAVGYNGFPRGCADTSLPWAKRSHSKNPLETKYPYVVHAEANAILNKNSADLRNSRIYVTLYPCCECAKLLIQAGIREVIYCEGKPKASDPLYDAARTLFGLAGVKVRRYNFAREIRFDIK